MEPVGNKREGSCEAFNVMGRSGMGKEHNFYATSPTSNNAGKHPTSGHLDDLTTEKNKDSFKSRQKSIDHVVQLIPVMKGGFRAPLSHAGTSWAFNDTTQWISDNSDWEQLRYSAVDYFDQDGNIVRSEMGPEEFVKAYKAGQMNGRHALCDSFLTLDELFKICINPKNSIEFLSAQYFLKPVSGSHQIFPKSTMEKAFEHNLPLSELKSSRFDRYGTVILWDPTHRVDKQDTHGDANGICVVKAIPARKCKAETIYGLEPTQNQFHVMRARQELGGADGALEWIENEALKLHPDLSEIWIEDNAAQMFLKPWLARGGKLPNGIAVKGIRVNSATVDQRLQAVATAFRRGFIKFPHKFPGKDVLYRQLYEYPKSDFKDLPASLALLCTKYERHGEIYSIQPELRGMSALETWKR